MRKIIMTGGGTAGHVTPNIALFRELRARGYQIEYIGSYNGMEKQLIEAEGIPYYGIDSGKLRRYFSLENFSDPFRVVHGYAEARRLLRRLKPDVIFSKGGYVSVPVVRAAAKLHIPVIIHESDMTPGLANRLAIPSAQKVCCNFPETIAHLPEGKAVLSGCPIRQELLSGSASAGARFCGFTGQRPVLLIMGGSQGSVAVNKAVRAILPELTKTFDVCHLCGKGNLDAGLEGNAHYRQYEYIKEELPDLLAMADVVISRAGANAICELLALHKSALLIPLSAAASRGDQILNARSFEKQGFAAVLEEEQITDQVLLDAVRALYDNRETYIRAMEGSSMGDPIRTIADLIDSM